MISFLSFFRKFSSRRAASAMLVRGPSANRVISPENKKKKYIKNTIDKASLWESREVSHFLERTVQVDFYFVDGSLTVFDLYIYVL